MRPRIRRTVEDIIDGWYGDGEIDLIEAFSAPLPARMIADLFGLPREDIPTFTRDSYVITRVFTYGMSADEIAQVEQAGQRLCDYVTKTLDDRRRSPRDDFLSAFLAAAMRRARWALRKSCFRSCSSLSGPPTRHVSLR
jgi:cytochrome P450 family 103